MHSRRRFIGFLLAAPTLVAAADISGRHLFAPTAAEAAIPSGPQPSELLDLNDLLTFSAEPTSSLIQVVMNADGTASFDMPRCESGQGVSTSTAMLIAEELDLPLDKIIITLADARPELVLNQFTAGSNTTISTYTPFRVAAALAKQALLQAAAIQLDSEVSMLRTRSGVVTSATGQSISYGELATLAAVKTPTALTTSLKAPDDFTIIGTPQNRIDARAAVTGQKVFTTDRMDIADALPTMIARPPTIQGTPQSVANLAAVKAMPGITDVVTIPTGVAVRGKTFGQCIDAVNALNIAWGPGTLDGLSDDDLVQKLKAAELPMAVPAVPLLTKTIDMGFTFYSKNNAALEPQTAIADVKADRAEVWSSMQSPVYTQKQVADELGMPVSAVTAHVMNGGGAFGRRMFSNVVIEAAQISKAIGKPVKLMWHRADEARVGRVHPTCTSRIRASYLGGNVLTFEQRHTSIATDYTMGFGEAITATAATIDGMGINNEGYSQTVFATTQNVPYNVGVVTQTLGEILTYKDLPSGSNRNLYSPDVATSVELVIDQLANGMRKDPYALRRELVKEDRARAVLDKVAEVGQWGKRMPAGTAQGLALHTEYKGATACLVELDARPETVNRVVRNAVTGPRVTKVTFAIDAGRAVNPRGLMAQMEGGIMDAIGQVLTESNHLKNGNYIEASWDNYRYTRQWNVPFDVQIIVMPPTTGEPGGAGEAGVSAAKAAVACAYARAVGKVPTYFPINHKEVTYTPYPYVPPLPSSPTDGLQYTR